MGQVLQIFLPTGRLGILPNRWLQVQVLPGPRGFIRILLVPVTFQDRLETLVGGGFFV